MSGVKQGVQSTVSESQQELSEWELSKLLFYYYSVSSTTLGFCKPEISSEQWSELGWC